MTFRQLLELRPKDLDLRDIDKWISGDQNCQ